MTDPSAAAFPAALHDHPTLAAALENLHGAIAQAVDPDLLQLARLRIAMLLRNDTEFAHHAPAADGLDTETIDELSMWPRSSRFGDRERACLDFVEQFMIDVSNMSDAQVEAVRQHLGNEGLVDFASAVLVLEQRQRMALAWDRIFPRRTA